MFKLKWFHEICGLVFLRQYIVRSVPSSHVFLLLLSQKQQQFIT